MGGCNIFGADPVRSRSLPKTSLMSIANHGLGHRVKEVHIISIARVLHPNPRTLRGCPHMPRPPETQSPPKLIHVQNTKPSERGRSTHHLPINFALRIRNMYSPVATHGHLTSSNQITRLGRTGNTFSSLGFSGNSRRSISSNSLTIATTNICWF